MHLHGDTQWNFTQSQVKKETYKKLDETIKKENPGSERQIFYNLSTHSF